MAADKKKEQLLSWDDFRMMGDPGNAPEVIDNELPDFQPGKQILRIHLDKNLRIFRSGRNPGRAWQNIESKMRCWRWCKRWRDFITGKSS